MWIKSTKVGYFQGWPGITEVRVHKYVKVVDATEKGNINQQRQGTCSTTEIQPHQYYHMDLQQQELSNGQTHMVFMDM